MGWVGGGGGKVGGGGGGGGGEGEGWGRRGGDERGEREGRGGGRGVVHPFSDCVKTCVTLPKCCTLLLALLTPSSPTASFPFGLPIRLLRLLALSTR